MHQKFLMTTLSQRLTNRSRFDKLRAYSTTVNTFMNNATYSQLKTLTIFEEEEMVTQIDMIDMIDMIRSEVRCSRFSVFGLHAKA